MTLQSITIQSFGNESGVKKNKKGYLIADNAFVQLYNAYVWRDRVKKREGLKLLGRFRRIFTDKSFFAPVGTPYQVNLLVVTGFVSAANNANPGQITTPSPHGLSNGDLVFFTGVGGATGYNTNSPFTITVVDTLNFTVGADATAYGVYTSGGTWISNGSILATEPEAEIDPGSVEVVLGAVTFTDQGNGLLTSATPGNIGFINYITGDVELNYTGAPTTAVISYGYFPSFPGMGIFTREIAGINDEQTIFFDTKYAYIHDGGDFQEFTSSGITWNGTDSDFFWCTNYRGSEAADRLFFETNFVLSTGSPMRYTDGNTWTTFQPITAGSTTGNEENLGTVTTPWTTFNGTITGFANIIEGSVVITVGSLVFKDTPTDGTLVSSGSNTGSIDYTNGNITLNFDPALTGDEDVISIFASATGYLFTARILIPYYGRLLALNVYEGASIGAASNVFNRCRYSQVGSPIQEDAWRSDVFGKGGFIDAPTNEEIISARFYKNVLIVQFEKSTWRLQYIGEYGTPFIWERISSDWGSESTFSTVLFDEGVLAVGDKAIVASSGNNVDRIDLDIPDTVYSFRNNEGGTKRVHGVREFQKELVYWCYNDISVTEIGDQYFPNTTLVYNYRNNTFAFFRNNTTCFGEFQYPVGITWDREDIFWDDPDVLWDTPFQENYPAVAQANQQGFCHFFCTPDAEVSVDSIIDANDQESLSVREVTVTPIGATGRSHVDLAIVNHNLISNEWIYLDGLKYVDIDDPTDPLEGSTTLNSKIYLVSVTDIDTIRLFQWDVNLQQFYSNLEVVNVGDYMGGGVVALLPKLEILTKDFNPAKEAGENISTSYIDFLFDATPNTQINVTLRMNTSGNANANMVVGNTELSTINTLYGMITGISLSNPCEITSPNHGLLGDERILIQSVLGTVEVNGNQYTVTFVDENTFSINTNATGFTTYVSGGQWIQVSESFYTLGSNYAWYRFFANSYGQFVQLQLSYSNDQMSVLSTHQSDFVWNAMQIWFRPAGRNIFGR